MRIAMVLVACAALQAPALGAQGTVHPAQAPSEGAVYTPQGELPSGRQIVVVFVGMASAYTAPDTGLESAVRRMKPLLARQAGSLQRALSINGLALDWDADAGYAYLKRFGNWDEVTVGNNWGNIAAERYFWSGGDAAEPAIPQVVVYERQVTKGARGFTFGAEKKVAEFLGGPSIEKWVASGALLPADRE